MKTVDVDLGERSYSIHIGKELLAQPELFLKHIRGRQVLVVTDKTVASIFLDAIAGPLQGYQYDYFILEDGEESKSLECLSSIYDYLLLNRHNRSTTIIALGGGVVGDIAGFAAASYQRGVDFIQIPTTLLAQVDSSVGGKTGVNHKLGKNMIGAFYQPQVVVIDTNTLASLDDQQLRAGLAEVIKYGLIDDAEFFSWIEENLDQLLQKDSAALTYAIERSCQLKAKIVAADEREGGVRALLNLGHTFGHAIETGLGYGNWLHGEAVACGMLLAAKFSQKLGWLEGSAVERISALLARAELPLEVPSELSADRLLQLMSTDKKVLSARLRLVLLKDIGNAEATDEFDREDLRALLENELQRS